uniref:DUF1634 domain-containing protein n=1 Tax=Candidatus Methanomethylicus mesodigestus TaxID=1867258 RepID=A0A7C3FCJ2_9CREN
MGDPLMVTLEGAISIALRAGAISSIVLMMIGLFTDERLIGMGIALLIMTPVFRVLISSVGFLVKKELVFVLLGFYVMLIFVISVLFAL